MLKKIVINNTEIKYLKPIRKEFFNKNNKFSAQGYFNNIKVKIYEVFDPNQGELRSFIARHSILSNYFPKLIDFDEKYIVEEWIDGITLKETNFESKKKEIKKFLNIMWSIEYKKEVFDYIEYIHKRLNKKNNFNLSHIPIRINHNDLSLDNILICEDGLKIIDNEFLGCNTGWILNINNSFLLEDNNYHDFISNKDLNKLWDIRKEWSKKKNYKSLNLFSLLKSFKNFLFKKIGTNKKK